MFYVNSVKISDLDRAFFVVGNKVFLNGLYSLCDAFGILYVTFEFCDLYVIFELSDSGLLCVCLVSLWLVTFYFITVFKRVKDITQKVTCR